jgi:glycosyltransferase involved in cell wall biosynthesis
MSDKKRVLVFIVSYNSESFIQNVLERIPEEVWDNPEYNTSVLVIDDQSSDSTFARAINYSNAFPSRNITILHNPVNQGYGGNQKIGFNYALKRGFEIVVLLHGDGQYAPEYLGKLIFPLVKDEADVVFGSRMINRSNALKGGMPLYKWIGNQILTKSQNVILGSKLSEFHSGYRAYRTRTLEQIPFTFNSNYFDFDTDIIIQLINTEQRIKEISIPTHYGEEICHVDGLKYAILSLLSTVQSRLMKFGIFYTPKFDYNDSNEHYTTKVGYASSHQFALDHIKPGMKVLDIGSGPGNMAEQLVHHGAFVVSVDKHINSLLEKKSIQTIKADLEVYRWKPEDTRVDTILLLDIIEHLRKPERMLMDLRVACMKNGVVQKPDFVLTTANIAFWPVRLGLLFGWFHYGKKGILDKDHHRLFTVRSLVNLLTQCGFDIVSITGIPAPYPLAFGDNFLSRLLLRVNSLLISISKGFFSYQIGVVAEPKPTLDYLLENAEKSGREKADLLMHSVSK